MAPVDRYAGVLRVPYARSLLAAATIARLPIGIQGLALVLFLRERTGSYGTAGAVAAVFAFGIGAGSPLVSRLIDRVGQRRVLAPLAIAHCAAMVALVALGLGDAHPVVLAGVALVAGVCLPPMGSVMRALWPILLGGDEALVTTAFAIDSVLVEIAFVVGPLYVALVTAVASPQVALLTSGGLAVVGTLLFASRRPSRELRPSEHAGKHGALGALRSPGLRILVLSFAPIGFCVGSTEVAIPAFSESEGRLALAGALLAAWSAASAIGGLWYGGREHRGALASRYARLSLALPLAYLPLALAPSIPVMALLLIPAGLCLAPQLTAGNQLAGVLAPAGTETEAYTWPVTMLIVGLAAGNAVAGVLVEGPGWETAFLAGAVVGGLGAVLAMTRRRRLVPAVTPTV